MEGIVSQDLLSVVATYTTTKSTLDLLTSFEPMMVYKDRVWKQKTIVESRGLILDTIDGGRSWWAYYLLKNCTLFGDVIGIQASYDFNTYTVPVKTLSTNIIYHTILPLGYHGRANKIGVIQTPDLAVRIGKIWIQWNRKIRDVVVDTLNSNVFVLDEYGDVWCYRIGDTEVALKQCILGHGITQITQTDSTNTIVLSRNGYLMVRDCIGTCFVVNAPKAIRYTINPHYGLSFTSRDYAGILTLSNGRRLYIHEDALHLYRNNPTLSPIANISEFSERYYYNFDHTRDIKRNDGIEKFLKSPDVISNISNWTQFGTAAVFTTKDRTLHLTLPNALNDIQVGTTVHRTQRLEPTSLNGFVYAIVDPH